MGKPSRFIILRARELRRNATQEEALLWQMLRGKALGHKIRRQHPLGTKIVDFYCAAARLAIEIDGPHHCDVIDQLRDVQLGVDVKVIRFTNMEVHDNVFDVINRIERAIEERLAGRTRILRHERGAPLSESLSVRPDLE